MRKRNENLFKCFLAVSLAVAILFTGSLLTINGVVALRGVTDAVNLSALFNEKNNDCKNASGGVENLQLEKIFNYEVSDVVASYAPTNYTVRAGDSMWKIAVKFEIGLSELIKANPHIKNPALIYVGQVLYIPETTPLKSLEQEVIRLVNVERVKNGLQILTYNWEAARVARIKSQDMIDKKYFNHISPEYGSPFKMMEDFGLRFSAAAENIAKGQRSAAEVMNSWLNSAGHRANILSRSVTHIGVGAAKDANGTITWTQLFFKPV